MKRTSAIWKSLVIMLLLAMIASACAPAAAVHWRQGE